LLIVDVTVSEVTNIEAEVTTNPVEAGPDVNDNIRLKPISINLDGFVSEAPLNLASTVQGIGGAGAGSIGNLAGGFGGKIAQ
ncbi:phage baseplate protein, partial [Lacticaseibacillus paracasei]